MCVRLGITKRSLTLMLNSYKCYILQVNLTNANLEGATATGNTSFKGSNIKGAGNN